MKNSSTIAATPRSYAPVPPSINRSVLGDFWPGIQLYYPPIKYLPAQDAYETMADATLRMQKYAHQTHAHTLIFDLEDGCGQKELSRVLLRHELPTFLNRDHVAIALRVNPFRTEEYEKDMALVEEMAAHIDVIMLAKAGEVYGAAEIRDLSARLAAVNPKITIQPIIEHPNSLKIVSELMQFPTVKHVVFGIHDFSKAMGIHITPEKWTEELQYYLNRIMFEARIAGKGVIGGVETLISTQNIPENFIEPRELELWLAQHNDQESSIVYKHACQEAAMGLTGKQVIHPSHIHLCKMAYTPSPDDIARKIAILEAAMEADALHGGAIRFEGEMLDPPMFVKALQTLLRAHALRSLSDDETAFAIKVKQRLQNQPATALQ